MMLALALALHIVAAALWVGGMFLLHVCLRPNLGALEPPQRLQLMHGTLGRFFPWVWGAVLVLPSSGTWLILEAHGGFAGAGVHIHIMQALGYVMMALFAHLFFAPWKRMRRAVAAADWPEAARNLGRIRGIVTVNLALGLAVLAVAGGGRYLG